MISKVKKVNNYFTMIYSYSSSMIGISSQIIQTKRMAYQSNYSIKRMAYQSNYSNRTFPLDLNTSAILVNISMYEIIFQFDSSMDFIFVVLLIALTN